MFEWDFGKYMKIELVLQRKEIAVNVQDKYGRTALHPVAALEAGQHRGTRAALEGNINVVRELLPPWRILSFCFVS